MTKKILPLFLLLVLPNVFAADRQWVLKQGRITYHVSHPLHQTEGVSRAARGKGVCHEGQCDFLIAVPVKSFDSGDSNRDLHMIQVTRGAEFPMVTVRTRLPETVSASATIKADLEVQFAGQTAHYQQVAFAVVTQGDDRRISGIIPTTLADFKIDPPSLMAPPGEERNSRSHRPDVESAMIHLVIPDRLQGRHLDMHGSAGSATLHERANKHT